MIDKTFALYWYLCTSEGWTLHPFYVNSLMASFFTLFFVNTVTVPGDNKQLLHLFLNVKSIYLIQESIVLHLNICCNLNEQLLLKMYRPDIFEGHLKYFTNLVY